MRRIITIAAHWMLGLLLVLLASGATWVWLYWLFGLNAAVMCGTALVFGLMNTPGPALKGFLRAAHPWMHRLLYLLIAWTGGLTLYAQVMDSHSAQDLMRWYIILTAAAAAHMIFHLWRHTALMDGALRRITPQAIHKYL